MFPGFAPSVADVVAWRRSLALVVLEGQEMSAKLLKVNEVAERLRCSRWGIYNMVRDGRLAAIRLSGRRLLFTEDAVEEAILNAECQGDKAGAPVPLRAFGETP
jgi:excisionase family DNA binding protein